MTTSTQWHLVRRPHGEPVDADFSLVEAELGEPGEGQLLVRNTFLSVDPYMRGRMNDSKSYVPPFELDQPMTGDAVGVVEAVGAGVTDATGAAVKVGDTVVHPLGWRTRALVPAGYARVVDTDLASPSAYLGVMGMTGRTAYAGLVRTAEFREGDRVFVSAAAGAVGSLVGQIARLKGASLVVGSAGGPDKVKWAVDEAGFDHVVDYKAQPIAAGLKEAAPEGIDVYFDNVGGDHLEAAISALRPQGRVAMCGAISAYNATEPVPGPSNLFQAIGKRLTLRGFLVSDHEDLRPEFEKEMAAWLADGRIAWRETAVEGIENAVEGFRSLLSGGNTGKMVVRL
ncbi:NADP-dependent oxidoreductase [Pedococcus sp. KACC 23699]|uniref:NADP-dependent oxidoreductase n=1 Tax=Pedococcus sp. KACC 23699 TaxID=3149228 RepID=A0AAU7JV16_9MICO